MYIVTYIFKCLSKIGFVTAFILKYDTGQEGCDLSHQKTRENILKYQLSDEQLVVTDLTGHATL